MDTWEFIFVTVCAWRRHPGFSREGAQAPSLEDCKLEADAVYAVIEERRKCLSELEP